MIACLELQRVSLLSLLLIGSTGWELEPRTLRMVFVRATTWTCPILTFCHQSNAFLWLNRLMKEIETWTSPGTTEPSSILPMSYYPLPLRQKLLETFLEYVMSLYLSPYICLRFCFSFVCTMRCLTFVEIFS